MSHPIRLAVIVVATIHAALSQSSRAESNAVVAIRAPTPQLAVLQTELHRVQPQWEFGDKSAEQEFAEPGLDRFIVENVKSREAEKRNTLWEPFNRGRQYILEIVDGWKDPFKSIAEIVMAIANPIFVALYAWRVVLLAGGLLLMAIVLLSLTARSTRWLYQWISKHPTACIFVYAGLGAGFGFLLWLAFVSFLELKLNDMIKECIVIVVVSIGVLLIIEPLKDMLSEHLGLPPFGHKQYTVLLVAILFLTGASHGFLENVVQEHFPISLGVLFASLLTAGGITLSWVGGTRYGRFGPAITGTISGAMGGIIVYALSTLIGDQFRWSNIWSEMHVNESVTFPSIMSVTMGSVGFLGGLLIKRPPHTSLVGNNECGPRGLLSRWGSSSSSAVRRAACGIVAASLISLVGLLVVDKLSEEVTIDLRLVGLLTAAAVGWASGLFIVEPSVNALFESGTRAESISGKNAPL